MSPIKLLVALRKAGLDLRLDSNGTLVIEAPAGVSVAQTFAIAQNEEALKTLLKVEALQQAEGETEGAYTLPPDLPDAPDATQQWEKQELKARRGEPFPLDSLDISGRKREPTHTADILRHALGASARGGNDILAQIARQVGVPKRAPQQLVPADDTTVAECPDPDLRQRLLQHFTRQEALGNRELGTVEITRALRDSGYSDLLTLQTLKALRHEGVLQKEESGCWKMRGVRLTLRRQQVPPAVPSDGPTYLSASLEELSSLEELLKRDSCTAVLLAEIDETICLAPNAFPIDDPTGNLHKARVVYRHDEWECIINACMYSRLSVMHFREMNRLKRKNGARFSVQAFLQTARQKQPEE